jgi:predicted ferric reductase
MKKLIIFCTLLWIPTLLFTWTAGADFFYWRHQLTILTGVIALGCMAISMLLAIRSQFIENLVNGLDKSYAIHKQMGIGALVFLCIHWLISQLPKWLIPLGLLSRPHRGGLHRGTTTDLINWTHLGKDIGEYTFYIFLVFAAISLIQVVRYHQFRWVHNIAGGIFLAGAFHSLLLMDMAWTSIITDAFIILACLIGSVCAVISLTGRIGINKRVSGYILDVHRIESQNTNSAVAHIRIKLDSKLEYRAGQFAFINFNDDEPPHPFTILNYSEKEDIVEFAIKDLGDYTHTKITQITISQRIEIEGGYGRFQIPQQTHQIWIGAGIGIVPFIAWLNDLAKNKSGESKVIHLLYCRHSASENYFLDMINSLINTAPYVQIHVYTSEHNQRLTAHQIAEMTNLNNASVCFCGPAGFSTQLSSELVSLGLSKNEFHVEHFKLR